MLFQVERFPILVILCGAVMVVKSENQCNHLLNEAVLECKSVQDLKQLAGLIKSHTKTLILRDVNRLSAGKNPGFTLDNKDKVKFLKINDSENLRVEAGDLSVFGSLESVVVTTSRWETIQTGSFSGLAHLRTLYLSSNHIKQLDNAAFEGTPNLQMLHLPENNLTILSSNAFSGLTNLEDLSLRSNKIATLERGVFLELTNMVSLDLSGNLLDVVDLQLFNPLTKLKNLYLSNNRISKVSGELQLPQLKTLVLDHNEIASLPDGVFDECGNLAWMDLSFNGLGDLTERPFLKLSHLMHLALGHNGASKANFATLAKQTLVVV